ncbi:acetyl/propionyl/methylcrotonyl-CoA carboxylase subunit alpha [Phenylobacterium montanum]|uniref:Acetyl/propionyl/methylcrotonyl-CoA carboxylase subunit alpha n=1 Tax=Phenylobacterium montanum TaxID=2823693 RepID=A0A975G211_9CAUL|nr:acetyl/propionyl/methylcrotonyl-CoA carboxylase subunit alpha [Caulobacter sp. S6]QUD89108.1 acetyl/propionyl/methylcrotonyl-CoA carboxylase subunit alpha [Caulobacter sp. S6]
MIGSVLIANRGEIARRVIRTARRLGVRTIAVYSEADAGSPHVREADAAVLIGPAPARESYLVQGKILAAAKTTGAEAIHPGYGFLSENAEFAEAVMAAGLTWIGPPPASIRAMGLKDAAKKLMSEAGVPVTPGYLGDDQSEVRLQAEADAIGYPVLIKAVAGGGGKGMRKVEASADFAAALASCRREAAASFGDDKVLLEKYVTRPRHIEVQVFADAYGNAVHLYERDCSLQRRHQKVIEEAPAPGMDEATRAAITEAAVRAAKAVGYQGAGTVEFIADGSQGLKPDRVWFMEMNTRLQVEHPVTEAVTGQDLVEWQLRVASGEMLPLTQDQIRLTGWAMEARLYAENPQTGFLPSTGPLDHFVLPDGIRVDSAVEEGGEVTPFYDPMIAKLIAQAPTRAGAAARLAEACRQVEIWPVKANAGFLARCLSEPDFVAGAIDTGFIERKLEALIVPPAPSDAVLDAAASALATRFDDGDVFSPGEPLAGFRMGRAEPARVRLALNGQVIEHRAPRADLDTDVLIEGDEVILFEAGEALAFHEPRADAGGQEGATSDGVIRSPMPGKIVQVQVKVGDQVAKGQPLITVEAMKMEHALTAPFDATVAEIKGAAGDQVSEGAMLVRLEAAG